MDAYENYLREKGNKKSSIKQTMYKMRRFFPDMELPLSALSPKRAARYYADLKKAKKKNGKLLSVDYHRNALAEARTFLKWCATKQRWLDSNPLDGVEGVGRRKHGKAQLRIVTRRRS